MSISFLHISDTHFLRRYGGEAEGLYAPMLAKMTPPMKQLVHVLENCGEKPDFAVLTGDLCMEGQAEDYLALKQELQACLPGVPVVATPGNHDVREAFFRGFLNRESGIGPHLQDQICCGVRILCLDSSDKEWPDGRISPQSCQWLRAALKQNRGLPTLLLTHHHLIPEQFDMPSAQFPPELREILENSRILAVLNGHTHHFFQGVFCGKPCYTADSLSFRCESTAQGLRFLEDPGATLFSLKEGVLSCRRIRTEQPPRELGIISMERMKGILHP